jgi:hypothetical protein
MLYLAEYCYSYDIARSWNFGLYVYVYNPQRLTFLDKALNKISIAVKYDNSGRPEEYSKFSLSLCSYSKNESYVLSPDDPTDLGNLKLFYKFKVIDTERVLYQQLNDRTRDYTISGIELISQEDVDAGRYNATEYNVGNHYTYYGFAKGYGDNPEESTLDFDVEESETLDLKVNQTYWRATEDLKDSKLYNQITSVYFTIPNEILRRYGTLQRIKAEWYEYQTTDIPLSKRD